MPELVDCLMHLVGGLLIDLAGFSGLFENSTVILNTVGDSFQLSPRLVIQHDFPFSFSPIGCLGNAAAALAAAEGCVRRQPPKSM